MHTFFFRCCVFCFECPLMAPVTGVRMWDSMSSWYSACPNGRRPRLSIKTSKFYRRSDIYKPGHRVSQARVIPFPALRLPACACSRICVFMCRMCLCVLGVRVNGIPSSLVCRAWVTAAAVKLHCTVCTLNRRPPYAAPTPLRLPYHAEFSHARFEAHERILLSSLCAQLLIALLFLFFTLGQSRLFF